MALIRNLTASRLYKYIKPLTTERRLEVTKELDEASSPKFEFFLMVVLSCSIATLGLLSNSAAVIIGAMLVAPLMSPILGLSLASIVGKQRMFRKSMIALVEGALIAVILSWFINQIAQLFSMGVINGIPDEVLARTQPSPFDLGIALAGGAAAAYALAQPKLSATLPGVAIATALMPPLCTIGIGISISQAEITFGAFLLFLTNFSAISFAGILVFAALGFLPSRLENTWRGIPRSILISAGLVVLVTVPLVVLTLRSINKTRLMENVQEVVNAEFSALPDFQLVGIRSEPENDVLNLSVTIRASRDPTYKQVVELQKTIAVLLQKPIALQIIVVPTTKLDPLHPPTDTLTFTPGPSPSSTRTSTSTPTRTQTTTPTPTITLTFTSTHTPTHTFTPTPVLARISGTGSSGIALRELPGGKIVGFLSESAPVLMLYRQETINDQVWIEIRDMLGRTGWVLKSFLVIIP